MKVKCLIATTATVALLISSAQAYWMEIQSEDGQQLNQFEWINKKGKYLEGKPWPKDFKFPMNYQGEFNVYYNTKEN